MPAIKPERREAYRNTLTALLERMSAFNDAPFGLEDGDITYLITKILVCYVKLRKKSYKVLKDVDGILGTASKEFYRQITAPYENQKFKDNDPKDEIYGEIR